MTTRFYFIDNEAGQDSNPGFIDAPDNFDFTNFQSSVNMVKIRSGEHLRAILPRDTDSIGIQNTCVLWKPRSDDGNYLMMDGVTQDFFDEGYTGNIQFRASDLTNSANDQSDLAGVTDQVGPNGDGSWTVNAFAGFTVTNLAGVLPAEDTLAGLKIQWNGNITAGLRNQGNMVIARSSNTQWDVATIAGLSVPVANDTFFFKRPGVKFTKIVNGRTGGSFDPGTTTVPYRPQPIVAGFRFTANVSEAVASNLIFCRFDAAATLAPTGNSQLTSTGYANPAGTFIITVCGIDFRGTATIGSVKGSTGASPSVCAFHAACSIFFMVGISAILNGSYCLLQPSINNCGNAAQAGVNGVLLGSFQSGNRPTRLVAGAALVGCSLGVGAIDMAGAATGLVITGDNSQIAIGASGLGPSGVVAGACIDLTNARGARVSVTVFGGSGTPDFALAGAISRSFVQLQADNFRDQNNNEIFFTAKNTVKRLTAGTLANVAILGADPAAPLDGDIWITDIATVRKLCVRIVGVTYRTTLV
jgi:hypothetical protein